MPTRLSARDRRRQILDVASGIFARKGYQGATTREIAEEAGVNEALLFRHFPSKESLYWTMLEELCLARGRHDRMKKILKEGEGGSDLVVFQAIAREILLRSPRDRELTRLLWFTALENHELSVRFFNTFVAGYYEDLAAYIRTRIRQGAFRRVDPLLAARGFLGMVVYHFLVQELFGGEQYRSFDTEEVAATLAGIWLAGMLNPVAHRSLNGRNGNPVRAGKKVEAFWRREGGESRPGAHSRNPERSRRIPDGRNGHGVRAKKKVKLGRFAGVREAKADREPAAEILSESEGTLNGGNGDALRSGKKIKK